MSEPVIEYACRWTGWTPVPGRPGDQERTVKYDFTGTGESGLREARRLVAATLEWQPHHDLPADAVVVSRPVSEWAEVGEGD